MAEQSETELLQEYHDYLMREAITLKKVTFSEGIRYQIKWERKVGNDYEADFTEFQTIDEARETFLTYVRSYVFKENSVK